MKFTLGLLVGFFAAYFLSQELFRSDEPLPANVSVDAGTYERAATVCQSLGGVDHIDIYVLAGPNNHQLVAVCGAGNRRMFN